MKAKKKIKINQSLQDSLYFFHGNINNVTLEQQHEINDFIMQFCFNQTDFDKEFELKYNWQSCKNFVKEHQN